jgi:FMN-dependent oxidoreductase (nitrilotriacetate monooxygenase family)
MPTQKPFHLAWFLQGSSIQAWGADFTGNISEEWMSASMFLDLARNIERAGMDYLLLEDSIYVGQNWQNSRDIFLKNGMSIPRQDPVVISTLMAQATSRLGICATLSTFAYHPYLVARITSTLDQISAGRGGWNMVTGSSDFAAQNFGLDAQPPHDLRYEMAHEYIDVVQKLWDSWEPGAIIADRKSGVLIDPSKVHTIDHKGKYYASRGPLNSGPSPQGRPVIAQAGGSPPGRQIAAKYADTIVAHSKGPAAMKEYRDDVRKRMVAQGRDPDSCKILFLISPIVARSRAEAQLRVEARAASAAANLDRNMAQLGWITNIDLSTADLDAPVDDLTTNGHQSSLAVFLKRAEGKTLREAMISYSTSGGSLELAGTPDDVAAQMEEAMQEVGGDGFLFSLGNVSRHSVAEICDGLVPALQQRGLTRTHYEHAQFRDNLLAF